jgi:long-chain acyl-CoA synthetase
MRLVDKVIQFALEHPNKVALVDADNTRMTYAQLASRIQLAASRLVSLGISSGNRVLIVASRSSNSVVNYLAVHYVDAITVLVDDTTGEEHKNNLSELANTRFTICDEVLSENPRWIEKDNEKETSTLADLLFTTGTTGIPKGVKISHKALMASVKSIAMFVQNEFDDVELIGLPLAHSFCLGRLRTMLYLGGTIVFVHGFAKMSKVMGAITMHGVTGMGLVPAAWATILLLSGNKIAAFKDQLKYIEFGSSFMSASKKQEVITLLPHTRLYMNFGLTESPRAMFLDFKNDHYHLDSIGRPSPGNQVSILDDSGMPLPKGEMGEICFRGPIIMSGYWNNETLTQASFHRDWFRSGDLGYETEVGYVYIFGRYAEVINVGGLKVSPKEVEDFILTIPGVLDVGCAKIADAVSGELVAVYIVKEDQTIDAAYIKKHMVGNLEQFKVPAYIEFIEKIPRAESGKIQRKLLQPKQIK